MPWIIDDFEPVYVDDPEPLTPQEMAYNNSACEHCHELLAQRCSAWGAIEQGCLIDGDPFTARLCWESMKARRQLVAA